MTSTSPMPDSGPSLPNDHWSRLPGLTEAVKADLRRIEASLGVVKLQPQQEEWEMGGLDEFLKGITPEVNDGFEILEGVYRCTIQEDGTGWVTQRFANGNEVSRFQIVADVTDVLKGNGNPGRRFWLRYNEDEKGLKRLLNDLFTAELLDKVNHDSVEDLKATVPQIAGSTLIVRGWGWAPEKDMQGNLIPEADREARQQTAVKSIKGSKRLLEKLETTPF